MHAARRTVQRDGYDLRAREEAARRQIIAKGEPGQRLQAGVGVGDNDGFRPRARRRRRAGVGYPPTELERVARQDETRRDDFRYLQVRQRRQRE
ncbi:MAG: hypothetical protein BWX84_01928 [Verrucomicrobia bacterium ADurb.Bin118]|nr:MAG: hypothetical protein BWX84_01928 [Verrucomicrobia bacterium ADurb.Bin118]